MQREVDVALITYTEGYDRNILVASASETQYISFVLLASNTATLIPFEFSFAL